MSSRLRSTPVVVLVTMVAPLLPNTVLCACTASPSPAAVCSADAASFSAAIRLARSMSDNRMFTAMNMTIPWTPNSTLHLVGIRRSHANRS